jgi:hypothetical protein
MPVEFVTVEPKSILCGELPQSWTRSDAFTVNPLKGRPVIPSRTDSTKVPSPFTRQAAGVLAEVEAIAGAACNPAPAEALLLESAMESEQED